MRRRDDAGAVAVLFGILALLLFVMAGLVVDLGQARDVRRQAQNASDSAALAAANALYPTTATCAGGTPKPCITAAVTAAKTYAEANYGRVVGTWNTCPAAPSGYTAPDSTITCVSFDSTTTPTRVRVALPNTAVKTTFGNLANVSSITESARASASVVSKVAGCGFCLLGSGQHDFGTTNLYATGTSVAMNGSLCAKKDFQVTPVPPGTIAVSGGAVTSGGCKDNGNISPTVTTGNTVTDPLVNLTMPDTTSWPNKGTQNPCTGGPGVYSTFSNFTSCTLTAGLYVITGATSVSGNGHDLSGTGVTLYFACGSPTAIVACTSANSKDFDMTSQNVHLNLTAATSAATATNRAVPNVAILADRGWTGTLSFQGGGGGGTTQGAIYVKSGTIHYGGNSDGTSLDSLIVANDFAGNGNSATLNITTTDNSRPEVTGGIVYLSD